MSEPKVAKEVAEAEFDRFVDAMDLNADPERMNAEELESFLGYKSTVVTAVKRGSLVFDGEGQPCFTPRFSEAEAITWFVPKGANLMSMDGKKKLHDVERLFAYVASCCKITPVSLAKLDERDLKVLRAIAVLFLAAR